MPGATRAARSGSAAAQGGKSESRARRSKRGEAAVDGTRMQQVVEAASPARGRVRKITLKGDGDPAAPGAGRSVKRTKPGAAKPEPAKPALAKRNATKRNATQRNATKGDPSISEAAKPRVAKPEAAELKVAKPRAMKREAAKPEAAKREAPKREAPKPRAAKREASKPETAPPESGGAPVHVPGEQLASLQAEYLARLRALVHSPSTPEPGDRRFAGDAWRQGPYAWTASLYLLNEEFMQRLAESVTGGNEKTRERIRFATQQWLAAISPANFLLTNPEAQQRVIETQGESLRAGIGNLLTDLRRGRISQTDETAFEVGVNVATSPGSVVFENELVQLIQYAPSTATVGSRPLLMVPPCINKFYILDLQPENSLVAYTVAQGHTVFVVSWKNVHADQGHLGWDDYLELGVLEPMRVVREISGLEHINTLGFCVGGTLLATAAAVLAARGDDWIESMTLLTSFIDFSLPGSIGVFVDEHQVAYRESTIGAGGIMPGRELALTFNYLRPNDLVWNYVVANYLKGEAPPAFDLLYWNADSTNLPGPMYCWYLRHMYLQNELRQPGRLVCLDVPVDVGEIGVPTYLYASREDHIVPWQGAYESTQLLSGPLRFVLGASGHIAGVINPPAKGKRSHWLGEQLPEDADEWFAQASERPGSWWPDWAQWLSAFAGETRPAPRRAGSDDYPPIEPAPGRYVKEKAG